MSPCVWRGNGAVLRAKPPLVEANVACTTTETDCLCCHSFTLSLSGSANGDINQSVDTHAEAVMCHHTEWAEDGWHIPTRGILYIRDRRLISRMQFKQVSTVDGFKFRLHGRLAKNLIKLRATGGEFLSCLIGVTQKWISEWCCRKKKNDDNESCLLTPCMFRSTSYRSRSRCGKETPEPITGWKNRIKVLLLEPDSFDGAASGGFSKDL